MAMNTYFRSCHGAAESKHVISAIIIEDGAPSGLGSSLGWRWVGWYHLEDIHAHAIQGHHDAPVVQGDELTTVVHQAGFARHFPLVAVRWLGRVGDGVTTRVI